ncbi:hypothetical protein SDC9_13848 [bioreactor metagenome]|uniref:Uncharacterized protein n=1 Tax=bioreactor metagenome TaxID=1076179 RepID=A0A644TME0_9ZZZZ
MFFVYFFRKDESVVIYKGAITVHNGTFYLHDYSSPQLYLIDSFRKHYLGEVIIVTKNNSNDSLEQKLAKKQTHNIKNKNIGNRHLDGPNHPST